MKHSSALDALTSDLHNSTEVRTRLNLVPRGCLLPRLDELPDQAKRDTQNPDIICFLTDSKVIPSVYRRHFFRLPAIGSALG